MNTTINDIEFAACACGCGFPVTTKSNYKPGHDARHAGQVARAAAKGYIDATDTDWMGFIQNSDLPSAALKAKSIRIAEGIIAKPSKTRTTRTKPAPVTEEQPEEATTVSSVKVGRWSYPARMTNAGKLERNEKRDGSGAWIPVQALSA